MRSGIRQHGTSLIEVLAAIVILLVGILSVVRLFPPGFLINQRSAEATAASRLAAAEVDRFTNGAANLMEDIVPGFPDLTTGSFVFDQDATPDDLGTWTSAPSGVDPYYVSDVNRMRRVIGETVRVPIPSPLGTIGSGSSTGERGSVYMLSLGPAVMVSDGAGRFLNVTVYGSPMIARRYLDSTDPDSINRLRGLSEYAIDYGDNQDGGNTVTQIGFYPASYSRTFRMVYDYYDTSTGQVATKTRDFPDVNDTRFPLEGSKRVIPAGYTGWVSLDAPTYDPYIIADSEIVSRQFKQLARADSWGYQQSPSVSDPYEFKVLSDNTGTFANTGVVAFNPLGRDYTEVTSGGTVPLTARIDYDVLDWRIIHEDRAMPASGPYQVHMTLKNIKKIGDMEEDQTRYPGMFRSAGGPDMLVCNVATGQTIPSANYTVDYKQGIVTFTDSFGAANAATNFRFFYKAQGEWALQVQKACSAYRRSGAQSISWDEFFLGYRYSSELARDVPCVYFSLCDAGKTVSVREASYLTSANGPFQLKTVRNLTLRINSDPANFVTVGSRRLTYADLATRDQYSDALYWPFKDGTHNTQWSYPVRPVVGMQGISFRARVVWSNGTEVQRTSAGNVAVPRWRKVDVDTVLTRKPE